MKYQAHNLNIRINTYKKNIRIKKKLWTNELKF